MTIDVYEDHIRFLGYHVPLDTSKLPATAKASLVESLNECVDAQESASDAEIADAEREAADKERERILDALQPHIEAVEDALSDGDNEALSRAVQKLRKVYEELDL